SGETEEIGKNVGDDLAEVQPTLPLISLMRHGSEPAANYVRHALENADRSYFDQIHDYVVNSAALPSSLSEAPKAVNKAIASLNLLPDSEVKEAMIQLAKESLARVS
ncbi:octaprenyl diphosphate synthase, partial [Neisseria sp. P0018.S002]